MSTLSWDTERKGADVNLTLQGELDLASSQRLEDELIHLEGDAPPLITLDLRGVTFIDSTGLSALINADAAGISSGYTSWPSQPSPSRPTRRRAGSVFPPT